MTHLWSIGEEIVDFFEILVGERDAGEGVDVARVILEEGDSGFGRCVLEDHDVLFVSGEAEGAVVQDTFENGVLVVVDVADATEVDAALRLENWHGDHDLDQAFVGEIEFVAVFDHGDDGAGDKIDGDKNQKDDEDEAEVDVIGENFADEEKQHDKQNAGGDEAEASVGKQEAVARAAINHLDIFVVIKLQVWKILDAAVVANFGEILVHAYSLGSWG